jgi:hypothetical protein
MIPKHPFDGFGLHLTAPVIDNLRSLILRKVKDIFIDKTFFEEIPGFQRRLMPADEPADGLPGIFIQQQIQLQINPLLVGEQVANIPAPPLIRATECFADRGEVNGHCGGAELPAWI